MGAQLGLEVAFWIPGLRAAGLLGPWGHGGDACPDGPRGGVRGGTAETEGRGGHGLPNRLPWCHFQGKRNFNTKPH